MWGDRGSNQIQFDHQYFLHNRFHPSNWLNILLNSIYRWLEIVILCSLWISLENIEIVWPNERTSENPIFYLSIITSALYAVYAHASNRHWWCDAAIVTTDVCLGVNKLEAKRRIHTGVRWELDEHNVRKFKGIYISNAFGSSSKAFTAMRKERIAQCCCVVFFFSFEVGCPFRSFIMRAQNYRGPHDTWLCSMCTKRTNTMFKYAFGWILAIDPIPKMSGCSRTKPAVDLCGNVFAICYF